MASFFRRAGCFGVLYVTGPQYLRLLLDLGSERVEAPAVIELQQANLYASPNDAAVRAAVLAGADEGNRACGSSLHPLEIRYAVSSGDRSCGLMRCAARAIVERMAKVGPGGFEGEG